MSDTRNILVTGGLGFIGSNLVNRLYELGHNIVNIDCQTYASSTRNLTIPDHTMVSQYFHPMYRYYLHNIVTMSADEWVRMHREDGVSPDIIIHTAAESIPGEEHLPVYSPRIGTRGITFNELWNQQRKRKVDGLNGLEDTIKWYMGGVL